MSKLSFYRCMKCGEKSSAEEWNSDTIDYLGDGNITLIHEIIIGCENECAYFICPKCGEMCYNEDGHIEEV